MPGHRVPDRLRWGTVRNAGALSAGEGLDAVAAILSSRLEIPVTVTPFDRYDDVVGALARGDVEMALLPPYAYVRARSGMPCLEPLLSTIRDGSLHYSSYVLVRRERPFTRLQDLAGRRLAFVDPSSASGYLYPVAALQAAGMTLRDLGEARFLKDHVAVVRAVIEGKVDAGATYSAALDQARRQGLDVGSLRILAIAGRVPFDAIALHPDIAPAFVERVAGALTSLDTATEAGRAALADAAPVNGWVRTYDAFYDPVRQVLARIRDVAPEAP